jgi:hypothetical protein
LKSWYSRSHTFFAVGGSLEGSISLKCAARTFALSYAFLKAAAKPAGSSVFFDFA